ncbi:MULTISPECIES: ACP S-malonyltransferase [Paenibacillus]|uniref:[acyl-carrier-protein] S-malonyltransferase n=1 Tax=Paenibacillus terrae TaxID=159743 RepID=A0A0D7WU30_9BACL|nr:MULTISPECIES: ACP S-malonyltransferase [Paenibacillus]KJD42675.1 hypothetical protein QD47_26890 [Paenibacillus terrae]MCP3781441.1 ACP S-malonyltransferase [Paenibacillus sp. MZ03-122A]
MNQIAVVFPGQGSQYSGMGKKWLERTPHASRLFEEANEAIGFDLKKLCIDGSMADLTRTVYTQPTILTIEMIMYSALIEQTGIKPTLLAGHSLGEITALCAAESIAFSDAVRLAYFRGKYMQEAVPQGIGGMSAVKNLSKNEIEKICADVSSEMDTVVPSNYNAKDQIVISGKRSALNEAGNRILQLGGQIIPLQVSAPFHSPLMKPAAVMLSELMKGFSFKAPKHPVLSNVTGRYYGEQSDIVNMLQLQLTSPVLWIECMVRMKEAGISTVIEAGPLNVLSTLLALTYPEMNVFSMDQIEIDALRDKLKTGEAGNINILPQYPSGINTVKSMTNIVSKCIAIAVCTRNRNWNNDEYQRGVIEPYRKVLKIQNELDRTGLEPNMEQMKEALTMLQSVFETKMVPTGERIERYNQLFAETGTRQLFPDIEFK